MICMLKNLLEDLSQYHRSKEEIMKSCINTRLEKSFDSYIKNLCDSIEYLNNRKPDKIMRKLIK